MAPARHLLPSDGTDRRSGIRLPVAADSTLRVESERPIDVILRDVSTQGCRIESREALDVGKVVSVGLAGVGATLARIVRREGDQYGCMFLRHLAQVDAARVGQQATVVAFTREQLDTEWLDELESREASTSVGNRGWPVPARFALIVGISTMLWAGLIAIVAI